MQQPKTKHDRSAFEQSVDCLACAMREMLGMGPAQNAEAATGKPEQPETDQKRTEDLTWRSQQPVPEHWAKAP